jgi:sodium/proline symporter
MPYLQLTMVLYMAACLGLGFVAWRRTRSLGDYLLGGRSLGSWVTALSAQASDMSGWLMMGLPGLAYASGLDAAWVALGLLLGTYLNWRWVAARLRRETEAHGDALTLPDYLERRFDDRTRRLRSLTALFILIFFTFYTSSGFVASGRLFQQLFGGGYVTAMITGSVVMVLYTFFGGFLAVSWSDVLQGTLMFVALILVALIGVHLAGGWGGMTTALAARDPTLLDPWLGEQSQPLGALGVTSLLAWGLGYPGQPHILARFMAARSADAIPVSRRVAMVWVTISLAAAVVVGLTGRLALAPPLVGPESEQVFILMSVRLFHPALAGLCMAAIMAAVMSTASAQLLVASSAFAGDLYQGLVRPAASPRELLWVGRLAVLAIAVVAFGIALDPQSRVFALVAWAWAGFGAAFGPTIVLSLYWPRMTRNGAIAGILVGGATVILWKQGSGGLFALYEMVPGVLFSALAIVGVSAWDGRRGRRCGAAPRRLPAPGGLRSRPGPGSG